MRFRLRTLLIVLTAFCVLSGWLGFLKRMAEFHRAKVGNGHALISEHPSQVLAVFMDSSGRAREREPLPGSWAYHAARAQDFEHAALRPWLAFVHCKPGSTFGVPIEPKPTPAPIIKRLVTRDDGTQQGDY
jgi:hypothetical protein